MTRATEPVLKDVSNTPVHSVEPLRVEKVESVHAAGETSTRGLDDQVIVVRKKAVAVARPAKALGCSVEHVEKRPVVKIVPKERAASNPASGDVKASVRKS
jgi:hypothetical protein